MQIDLFLNKLPSFEKILYKTLSANDYKWANVENIHQAGVLIPKELADFFPPVDYSQSIFTADINTFWIEEGKWIPYNSKWKYYESKTEWRVTTVSKQSFIDVASGSLLLMGKNGDGYYSCVVNSEDQELFEYVLDMLELREAPRWGVLRKEKGTYLDEDGKLDRVLTIEEGLTDIPSIIDLSTLAEKLYSDFNSDRFEKEISATPGDYLDKLIEFEYKIYKRYESEVFSTILAKESEPHIYKITEWKQNKEFYRLKLDPFSNIFTSMSQRRKSRVGKTFEYHFRSYFNRLSIPFSFQEKVDGKKKPDFILPSKDYYYSTTRNQDDAILLSLKTTLKERWQQILNEGSRVKTKYLATLDKAVTTDQINEMAERNVILVVTEWAKNNSEPYRNASNVITVKAFSEQMQDRKNGLWI